MESKCRNCSKEFKFFPSQSNGFYCSNKCQGEHKVKEAIESGNYTRSNAVSYFKKYTEYKCNQCGISEWNGKELRLQIDHIDGNNKNDKIENYRYLCPNCHTQTDTWGVKNVSEEGRKRLKEGAKLGNDIRNSRMPSGTKLVS